MKDLRTRLGKEWLFFDGGTGSVLQAMGLKGGELPETWNLRHPDRIRSLYEGYLKAGADIFNANTFGANRFKYGDQLEEIITAGITLAKEARIAVDRPDTYIALDMGPTGKLLRPMGDLGFEEAVDVFAQIVRIGVKAGADLVMIETMGDSYETKAAVLAAKENSDLPVIVTNVYDSDGRLLTGGSIEAVTAMLEGLRVDALGMNCGLGPKQMLPLAKRMMAVSSTPVVITPNAGLPRVENGKTVYDVGPEEFAEVMTQIADLGISAAGGCCGTTPEHIRQMVAALKNKPFREMTTKDITVVTSFSRAVEIGKKPVIIGERINPTGKKRLKAALRENDVEYILSEGLRQEDEGADILDVNVGLPEIDEPAMMEQVIVRLQSVTPLPLQIDTSDPAALERALRLYNGKPLINSVNGKEESIEAVMPLCAKYGGVLVGLALDEEGIPENADGRIRIAKKIYDAAERWGIPRKDVIIDGLALTISSDTTSARTTLETLRRVRDELNGRTILGVSNISFGLPAREVVNAAFLALAIENGLSCAIMNPGNGPMMRSFRAACALLDMDSQCMEFIENCSSYIAEDKRNVAGGAAGGAQNAGTAGGAAGADGNTGTAGGNATTAGSAGKAGTAGPAGDARKTGSTGGSAPSSALQAAVIRGIGSRAADCARELLQSREALSIINDELIPALDIVGQGFEKGTMFLPQLLMSAEAARAAFDVIRESMTGTEQKIKGRVILATVRGDIHDIGKNIVKVMLENYGYDVIDLGKDVLPETVVETAIREDIRLVGLSALMTTTVVSMEKTIQLLKEKKPDCKVVVGGAVMTKVYADAIGADCYAKDAMATVRYADMVFDVTT